MDIEQAAFEKLDRLERMMREAEERSIDVTREETLAWFSRAFLKFADWDEANRPAVEALFGRYHFWSGRKEQLAKELPEFERQKVNEILDRGIQSLQQVLDGTVQRRPAVRIHWERIELGADQFTCGGRPVFLYDYFSKSLGNPTSDANLYNDYLGNIDRPECISTHCLASFEQFDIPRVELVTKHPDTRIGHIVLWHMEQPDWVYRKDPEVGKGTSLFIGYDIDNPMMRDAWSRILEKVGREGRGKRTNQTGYMLANEPHWYSNKENWFQQVGEMNVLSRYTLATYRAWLSQRHEGRVEVLNRRWMSEFESFDQVEFEFPLSEASRGQPRWYDWCRFNMDRGTEWVGALQSSLQAGDPDAQTHVKIMPHLFTDDQRAHGIDLEAITELTTMIGNDAKTGGRKHSSKQPEEWEARYAYHWRELCVSYDFMESVSPDKIHVNSESHFISTSLWRELDLSPEYVRSSYWLATLLGMDANLTWFWARDPDGSPEHRLESAQEFKDPALAGSYAGSVNMQPQVANEVTQVMIDLNAYAEELMMLRRQRRPIRLFHSETSAINKRHHMSEQFELYEALQFEGTPLGFVTEKILRKQDHGHWHAVLVYRTAYVTDAEFDELQHYLDKGGVVLVDHQSLTLNEYGETRERRLQESGGTLLSLGASAGFQVLKDTALSVVADELPALNLSEDNGTPHKGCIWRVAPKPGGGSILNVLNIGNRTARLNTTFRQGGAAVCTNMLTAQVIGSSFELEPNGVLLLSVSRVLETD